MQEFKNSLSEDSKIRLEKNPLRILDSKDVNDQKLLEKAPLLSSCLNSFSQDFFAQVLNGLQNLKIPYLHNEKLVRGLDYYTHTVFEFTTQHLGSQGAVLAGGRYDGLIELMGGPTTPGIGWAAGMERLALLLESNSKIKNEILSVFIPADEKSESFCWQLAFNLRQIGHTCQVLSGGNMGKKMKKANKLGAKFAIIIGENEMSSDTVTLKNLMTGEQTQHSTSDLHNYLR